MDQGGAPPQPPGQDHQQQPQQLQQPVIAPVPPTTYTMNIDGHELVIF